MRFRFINQTVKSAFLLTFLKVISKLNIFRIESLKTTPLIRTVLLNECHCQPPRYFYLRPNHCPRLWSLSHNPQPIDQHLLSPLSSRYPKSNHLSPFPLLCCCCCCLVASVVSDSVRPHRRQPTRLLWSLGFSRQEYWSGLPLPSPLLILLSVFFPFLFSVFMVSPSFASLHLCQLH